jgi:voltage-gated potassium channel
MPSDDQKLFTPDDARPLRILTRRSILLVLLIALTVVGFWFHRDQIRMADGSAAKTADVIGYVSESLMLGEPKDYTPATPWARLMDAIVLNLVKVVVLLVVFGTAYEVLAKRFLEWIKMSQLKGKLSDHVLICGFGPEGEAAARELLAKKLPPDRILPIEADTDRLEIASKLGLHGLRGDSTNRETLEDAAADKARAALVCTGRDDANLLTTLAIRAMNKDAVIVASVTDPNNERFLQRGGANFVLTHASVSGILMAGGVISRPVTNTLLDLISAEGLMDVVERPARRHEIGKKIVEIDDTPAIQILRGDRTIGFWDDAEGVVQAGDRLIVLEYTPRR